MKRPAELTDELQVKRLKFEWIAGEAEEIVEKIKRLKVSLNEQCPIGKLPTKTLSSIFGHLELEDIHDCALVCQRWAQAVKELNIERLMVAKSLGRPMSSWFYSGELCRPAETIILSTLDYESPLWLNLKQLKILNFSDHLNSSIADKPLLRDLHFLNKLVNLETLEVARIELENEATLTLPNLRRLSVACLGSSLKLATPKLTTYKSNQNLNRVHFVYPARLIELHLKRYTGGAEHLTGLKFLSLKDFRTLKDNSSFLTDHRRLSTVSLRPKRVLNRLEYYENRHGLLSLLEQKRQLERHNLKIIFFGIEVQKASQIDFFNYDENLIELQIRNYSMLNTKELRYIRSLHYGGLLRCFGGEIDRIPSDLPKKFGQVEELIIGGPDGAHLNGQQSMDLQHLAEFAKRFPKFNSLKVKNVHAGKRMANSLDRLPDKLYEELPVLFPQLLSLQVDDPYFRLDEDNLDCVHDFDRLYRLHANVDEGLLEDLFRKFRIFDLSFPLNGGMVRVRKATFQSRYELYSDHQLHGTYRTLGELRRALDKRFTW